MNHAPSRLPTPAELVAMHDAPVLVNPGHSEDNPAVGLRGTIRVTPDNAVEVDLQFAVMFGRPAATTTMRLSDEQVAALVDSKARHGDYALKLDHPIEPPPPTLPDVVPNLLPPDAH